MNKPSQFVFLSTDKASNIMLKGDYLYYSQELWSSYGGDKAMQLYILSDDKIKEDEWAYNHYANLIQKMDEFAIEDYKKDKDKFSKIIATTNPELNDSIKVKDRQFTKALNSLLPSIYQSDIEYIISLYNGKGKEVDVEKLADEDSKDKYWNNISERWVDTIDMKHRKGFIRGYNQCLQDNADKKWNTRDMIHYGQWLEENDFEANQNSFDKFLEECQPKEQPKRDTVVVEYEFDDSVLAIDENDKTMYVKPELKDGNIVIVR